MPAATKVKGLPTQGNEVGLDFTHAHVEAESESHLTFLDLAFTIISIVVFLYDVLSDLYLAYVYYIGSWWTNFALTTITIFIPSIITAFLRFNAFRRNRQDLSCGWRLLDFCITVLHFPPLIMTLEYLYYSVRAYFFNALTHLPSSQSAEYKTYAKRVMWLLANMAVMRLIESFIEAIPQISLQVYIAVNQLNDPNGPMGGKITSGVRQSVGTSLVSCAWSICFAYKAFVCGSPLLEKTDVSIIGLALMFTGYLGVICARFFALEFLFVTSLQWFLMFCGVHWVSSLVFSLLSQFFNQTFPKHISISYLASNAIRTFSFVFMFVFIIESELGRRFYIVQCIMLVENLIISAFCFLSLGDRFGIQFSEQLFSLDGFCIVVVPQLLFALGLLCLHVQNVKWRTNEVTAVETKTERLKIIGEILVLVGISPKDYGYEREDSAKDSATQKLRNGNENV